MLLYHGSDVAIPVPDVSLNTGFADLGRGFYLTDDRDAARGRAASRARATGAAEGFVSSYEFDGAGIPWLTAGAAENADVRPDAPFGLAFAPNGEGLLTWIGFIKRCRGGDTAVEGFGEPAVVRAWIATMEVEMACSGLAAPADVLPAVEPDKLVVQYCIRAQEAADTLLWFAAAEPVPVRR